MGKSDSEMLSRSANTAKPTFFHLAVLLGLVLAVFLADYVLFAGNSPAHPVPSVRGARALFGSADWVAGGLLLAGGCHAVYLRSRKINSSSKKSPKSQDRPERPEAERVLGSPAKLHKSAQQTLNYQLGRASCGKAVVLEKLVLDFEAAHGPSDTLSYNLVIRAFAKEGQYKAAGRWLTHMEKQDIKSTVCSYNTVLDACAKAGKAKESEFWLQRMLDRGLQPNVISFATVIHAFARSGDEHSASIWQKKMVARGIEPDSISYNSLIHACSVKGQVEKAEHWLKEMREKGLEATVTTYASLIDAAAKAGDLNKAETWMNEMLSLGIQPNVVSFGAVINACAKACNLQRAEHWHARMLELGIRPNLRSYSAVINACAKAGKADQAEEWLVKLEDAGLESDAVVYSSVIDACGKAGDCERAMAVFKRMQARAITPHVVTYSALARPFAYRGNWHQVEALGLVAAAQTTISSMLSCWHTRQPGQKSPTGQRASSVRPCGMAFSTIPSISTSNLVSREHLAASEPRSSCRSLVLPFKHLWGLGNFLRSQKRSTAAHCN